MWLLFIQDQGEQVGIILKRLFSEEASSIIRLFPPVAPGGINFGVTFLIMEEGGAGLLSSGEMHVWTPA